MADTEHAQVRDRERSTLLEVLICWDQSGVNQRTWYSWGCSLPSLAFLAKALVSAEMVVRPFEPTSVTIGVINPVGVATAIEMSAFFHL